LVEEGGNPCLDCGELFCSVDCCIKLHTSLNIDCRLLSGLRNLSGIGQLALKILLNAGIRTAIDIYNEVRIPMSEQANRPYLGDYESLIELCAHPNQYDVHENLQYSLAATFLYLVLKESEKK